MRNKKYIIFVLFISLILLFFISFRLFNCKAKEATFSSLCVNQNDFEKIINDKKENKTPLIKELFFNANRLFYDEKNNHFYYSLVNYEKNAYDPVITWNSDKYNILIKETEINEESIHKNETIQLLIYNKHYYSITELSCTTLPLININVSAAKTKIGETYQDMKMTIFDNENAVSKNIKGHIEARGSTSLRYPKKSFKIKLDYDLDNNESINFFDFKNYDSYILYPAYNDQERIRNVFSTNLWYESCADNNIFSIKAGQKYEYFEMFLNGEYWGLYAIAFSMNEDIFELDLDKDSDNFLKENYYKKAGANNEFQIDFDSKIVEGYDLKTNIDYIDAWEPLKYFYKVLLNAKNVDDIYEVIDVNNTIDIFLFYNLIQGVDNVSIMGDENNFLHNTYLFSKVYNGKIKMLYVPWDMDRTWGNGKDGELYIFNAEYNSIMKINPIFFMLNLEDTKIVNLIKERYENLRNTTWSDESIAEMLEGYEKEIFKSGAYQRDIYKWPNSQSNDGYNELETFKNYVESRLEKMDEYINKFCNINLN